MKINLELLKGYVADEVVRHFDVLEVDATKIADTKATIMLGEIYAIMQNENMEADEMIEAITKVYYENNLDGVWWME